MGQKENMELLLKLHGIITGKPQTLEQIISQRSIDPDISLIHDTELSGKVASGDNVSIKDYYTLGEHLDDKPAAQTR